ncbi:MAG TPA: hypothetical protein VGM83_15155 [Devosiaceae bacterium]|jgi:hypothetical protein
MVDSQNRPYVVGFALPASHADHRSGSCPLQGDVAGALAVLFASGMAGLSAWAFHGMPVLIADLVLPPLHYLWMRSVMNEAR